MIKTTKAPWRRYARGPGRKQSGVVLLFSMIALVIMLIGSVAMIRSMHSSMAIAGNVAFKRDMQNQSERAVDVALTAFRLSGDLNTAEARAATDSSNNYSAAMLAVNGNGIPRVLGTDSFTDPVSNVVVGVVSNDIAPSGQAITIRYVIDRQCATVGDELTLGAANCKLASNPTPAGSSSSNLQGADRAPLCPTCASAAPQGVIYRLSIRANGPRGAQSFYQTTFTVPSTTAPIVEAP